MSGGFKKWRIPGIQNLTLTCIRKLIEISCCTTSKFLLFTSIQFLILWHTSLFTFSVRVSPFENSYFIFFHLNTWRKRNLLWRVFDPLSTCESKDFKKSSFEVQNEYIYLFFFSLLTICHYQPMISFWCVS